MLKIKIKMNIKLVTIITLLFLCFILGFEKTSFSLNKSSQNNISELKILKYLPKDSEITFISNSKSSQIIKNIRKNYNTKNQDDLILIKDTILAYLGIDLGTNKLEEIYNNELAITIYDNKETDLEDVLIIFKINEEKDIDDVLNLTNKTDEPEKLIKIFREKKLNYLNYIYRTNDNYILTSSNKSLILKGIKSRNDYEKGKINISYNKILSKFESKNNILLTKNFKTYNLLNRENYFLKTGEFLATLFDFEDNKIIMKSYLINNKKSVRFISYEKIFNINAFNKENFQIYIYNDLLNYKYYIDHIKINSFEKAILKELNEKLKQNFLFLVSENNWIIIFDKNNLSIGDVTLLKDFNKNSLENNNYVYTIYSKDILKKEDNIIKESNYKNIFLVQSKNLTFISNSLINDSGIDSISKEFLENKGDNYAKYFLNKTIDLKNPNDIRYGNFSYLKNINRFLKNLINLSIIEFKEILKQSIPELDPIYYTETDLKIF